jgi:hypothetical protein
MLFEGFAEGRFRLITDAQGCLAHRELSSASSLDACHSLQCVR